MGEHPAELHVAHAFVERGDVFGDGFERRVVGIAARELEQLGAVADAGIEPDQRDDDVVERLLLLAELLRALRIVPDLRVLELARNLRQPRRLGVEVKDTSAGPRCVPAGP
jgi:hypothetical protein